MGSYEETSKSQLGEIRDAMSKISTLRARTVYLRRTSQDNHVKRMQFARSMGEHLSPVFILPASSPVREPKFSQVESPAKPKSPKKTAVEENKQVKDKTFHQCKIINQKDEKVLKSSAPEGLRKAHKEKDDKINSKQCKSNQINKSNLKRISFGKFSKREKAKSNETGKKSIKNNVCRDKASNKMSPKRISLFYGQSPISIPIDLEKEDDNACAKNYDDVVNSSKQMTPNESSKPEEAEENASDKPSSKHELSNSLKKLDVEETNRRDILSNRTLNSTKDSHSLKRSVKKSIGLPKHKSNHVKSSQNKDKKIKVPKNKSLLTNVNKNDRSIKIYPKTVLTTIVKKDSSVLSHSVSLDSLEDLRKTLKETISSAPRTMDKVRNFINDKKDLMTSISLENESQREKMADISERSLKSFGFASGSKIPVHEFRTYQSRSNEKVNEILEEPLQDKHKINDKKCFADVCYENTGDILPLIDPFKDKKHIVKSWLKNVPDVTQENAMTRKKTREYIPNSKNSITASNICKTRKQTISQNDTNDFLESKKQISTASKSFNYGPGNKTPETHEPAAISNTISMFLSSPVPLTESTPGERNRSTILKNNLDSIMKAPNFKLSTDSKDFLFNPIEKFMNEINFAVNHSDSEEGIIDSSLTSASKSIQKTKFENQAL